MQPSSTREGQEVVRRSSWGKDGKHPKSHKVDGCEKHNRAGDCRCHTDHLPGTGIYTFVAKQKQVGGSVQIECGLTRHSISCEPAQLPGARHYLRLSSACSPALPARQLHRVVRRMGHHRYSPDRVTRTSGHTRRCDRLEPVRGVCPDRTRPTLNRSEEPQGLCHTIE
jgi:hypothetical protein